MKTFPADPAVCEDLCCRAWLSGIEGAIAITLKPSSTKTRYLELRMFDDAALALEEIKPYAKSKSASGSTLAAETPSCGKFARLSHFGSIRLKLGQVATRNET